MGSQTLLKKTKKCGNVKKLNKSADKFRILVHQRDREPE